MMGKALFRRIEIERLSKRAPFYQTIFREITLRDVFHLSLAAIEELEKEERTIYNPIELIDTAHQLDEIVSFKQKMNACDTMFRTLIYAHVAECNSKKSQMKRFTRMFLRANVKYAKYSKKYLFWNKRPILNTSCSFWFESWNHSRHEFDCKYYR